MCQIGKKKEKKKEEIHIFFHFNTHCELFDIAICFVDASRIMASEKYEISV